MAALTAPGQKLVGGGTDGAGSEAFRWRHPRCRVRSFSVVVAALTALGQKLVGGGTDGAGSEAFRWRHRRRRVRSFSVAALTARVRSFSVTVAALTAPGQKLVGGGTDGAGSEAFRWRH